jgi:glycosyltransferase involved in cell wall biosynthesis
MATVDIIVPLYNKEGTIDRTIRSIQNQTFSDWALIIVDDGSTDEGPDKVRQLNDGRIKLIHQDNMGPGPARNRGIEEATAEYVAFLDADDEWYPWYLENSIAAIKSEDVSFVGSMYYEWPKQIDMTKVWDKRGVKEGVYEVNEATLPEQIESWALFFHVGTTVVKRDIAKKYYGFYDDDRCLAGEDTIFFAKLVLNEKFKIIGPASVRHNRQDSDLSMTPKHPITPLLLKPQVLMDYCPQAKKAQARLFLAKLALRTAHHKARNGLQSEAQFLVENFPEMSTFGFAYYKLILETKLSRYLPHWVRFKCWLGPPARMFIKKTLYRLRIIEKPPSTH